MENKLLDNFEKLSQEEQDILLALSIVYAPIGQTRFQEFLKQSYCVPAEVSNLVAKPLREKLVSLELIEATPEGWICSRAISEVLMKKMAGRSSLFDKLTFFLLTQSLNYNNPSLFLLYDVRDLRIYLYRSDEKEFINHIQQFEQNNLQDLISTLESLFFQDFDADWFNDLSATLRLKVLQSYQLALRWHLMGCDFQYRLMNDCFKETHNPSKLIIHRYAELHLLRGDFRGIEGLLEGDDSVVALKMMGMMRFMEHRNEESVMLFDAAWKALKKETRKRNICLDDFPGYFFHLALLCSQTPKNQVTLTKQLQIAVKQHVWQDGFLLAEERLLVGLKVYQAKAKITDTASQVLFQYHKFSYDLLFCVLLLYWLGETDRMLKKEPLITDQLNAFCEQADQNNYFWFAAVSAGLLERLSAANKTTQKIAQKYRESEFNAIIDLLPRIEPWERALDALTKLGGVDEELGDSSEINREYRMVWAVTMADQYAYLAPKEQRMGREGISYQYLDGATTIPKRKAAVKAFQSGEGDLFLISLKAGGAGLNLTAADYVVHMDPWWNPAVEDQASDRAHRIGQKRPVTIYRLVAKGTIEDKIVDLHRHKRDLANSLLEGGEISGKMSVKDMLELIREID